MRIERMAIALLGAGLLCAPAVSAAETAQPPAYTNGPGVNGTGNRQPGNNGPDENTLPGPGTINYIEGAVYLNGQPLGKDSVGITRMAAGQVLTTHEGRAEVLLNPGIYMRVGHQSEVKMISPALTPTTVEVLNGETGFEVDQLLKENVLQVVNRGVTTQLVKTGYYQFDANTGQMKVFSGQAEVEYANDKWQKVKGGREVTLEQGVKGKESKFEPNPQADPLMAWSKLRSQYLAESNWQMAPEYYGIGINPGWYWDPYMWNYTFIGSPFVSPFGWGYYPLGLGWGGWGWGGWGWGGLYHRGFYHAPGHGHFRSHAARGR